MCISLWQRAAQDSLINLVVQLHLLTRLTAVRLGRGRERCVAAVHQRLFWLMECCIAVVHMRLVWLRLVWLRR